jgi:preprotein translocase subunit SecF
VAARVSYSGAAEATLDVSKTAVTVSLLEEGTTEAQVFAYTQYPTLGDLASAVNAISGITMDVVGARSLSSTQLVGFSYPVQVSETVAVVNYVASANDTPVSIDQIRQTLEPIGGPQIQMVGASSNQEFLIRVLDSGEIEDFSEVTSRKILDLLGASFGADQVLVRQSDYVGARFSGELGSQTVSLTIMALFLILIYIWIRFQLAFAVSAVTALVHDVLIMLGFIGAFQMEVVTATIAAVLTIIGYSLNDTIVIFDRIRENQKMMRDSNFTSVINTSITQSLSRTVITSLTTLLAVVSLYIFGSGPIKDFALAMIVGVVVGTYSSIFVASPVLLLWSNVSRKRRQGKESQKYGVKPAAVKPEQPVPVETEEPVKPESSLEIPSAQRRLKGKRKKK